MKKSKLELSATTAPSTNKINTAVILADLKKEAKPLFNKLLKVEHIKTAAEFDFAGQQLKLLKIVGSKAKESRDGIIKPMRDGLTKTIEKLDEHYKPFFQDIDLVEVDIKLKMSVYLEASKNKKSKLDEAFTNTNMKVSTYASKIGELTVHSTKGGAQVRKVWEAELVDKNKVPRKYLVPDMKSVEHDLRAGKKVPGFIWKQVEKIAI